MTSESVGVRGSAAKVRLRVTSWRYTEAAGGSPRPPGALLCCDRAAPAAGGPMRRCESHFNPSFGNVLEKHLIYKKLKLTLSPSPQGPQAALRLGGDGRPGKFLRQTKPSLTEAGPSLESPGNPSNPFQKPLEVQ